MTTTTASFDYIQAAASTYDTWCLETGRDLDIPTRDDWDRMAAEGLHPTDAAMSLIDHYNAQLESA